MHSANQLHVSRLYLYGVVVRMSILDTNDDGSIPSINMFSPGARDCIRIASVDSAVKLVPGGDNLVKGVQCYELFGGIALKIHTFSFFSSVFIELLPKGHKNHHIYNLEQISGHLRGKIK